MTESPSRPEGLDGRLRRGDAEALGELLAMHRARLWRIVNFRMDRRLAGRADVDDVLQEAFLAARQRIAHYGEDGFTSPFLWLRLIVQQTLIDVHRRHLGTAMRDAGREVPMINRYPQATSASLAICLAGDWTSPSQAAVRGETVDEVQSAIATMSEIDQEVLALRHFEELSNGEVAEVLGIEPKAASIRYVRALQRLKQVLAALPGAVETPHDG